VAGRAFFTVKDAVVSQFKLFVMRKQKTTTALTPEQALAIKDIPERLDIRIDWAFKHLFSKKRHLIKIIKDLLDLDIEVIEYEPNGLDVATEQDKKSVFDVICNNKQTGERFVLEMQTTYESDMNDRLYYYGGSLIHNQVSSGDMKYNVKSVLILCIASYRVPHKEKVPSGKVFFKYQMRESETHEVFDGDKLSICFLELNRFGSYLDKDADLKKQWCWIFNNLSNFAVRPEHLDPSFDAIIKDAGTHKLTLEEKIKYMEALHLNERERLVVHEGGYIIGKEDGKAEGKEEIARSMLSDGVDPEIVSKYTGLTIEEMAVLQ
jgi:predicted transposase/invertase (TIGR01784 family)